MSLRTLSAAAIAGLALSAWAQDAPVFRLKQSDSGSGLFPRYVARSVGIPFDKRYAELSPEQKQFLADFYEDIGPLDEPPFPAEGLGPIVQAIHKAQRRLLVTGDLYVVVDVAANGEAQTITAYGSPSPEMTNFAASVLMLSKYKPALCNATPCSQKYPFYLKFEVR